MLRNLMARFFAVNALLHLLQVVAQGTCRSEQVQPNKGGMLLQSTRLAGNESRTSELLRTSLRLRRVMPAGSDKEACKREFGLCDVLIVFNHFRDDRKIFLEGYRRFFWGVWYAPKNDLTYAVNSTMNLYHSVFSVLHSITQYPSDLSVLQGKFAVDSIHADLFMNRRLPVGVLFPHMDMWFNPHVFRSQPLDLRKMWAPCGQPRLETKAEDDVGSSWTGREIKCHWVNIADSDVKHQTEAASFMDKRFQNDFPTLWADMKEANAKARAAGVSIAREWPGSDMSFSWNDIAYYPQSSWANLMELLPHYVQQKNKRIIFHEVAMPTIQDMLVHSHAIEREWLDCAGGCCQDADLKLMSQKVCGHKIRLDQDVSRVAMATMLGLPVPTPCEPNC